MIISVNVPKRHLCPAAHDVLIDERSFYLAQQDRDFLRLIDKRVVWLTRATPLLTARPAAPQQLGMV